MVFVTANIGHTLTIKQAENNLATFLPHEHTGLKNKQMERQSAQFPSICMNHHKAMDQCLKVELRYDSRMINGTVCCLI